MNSFKKPDGYKNINSSNPYSAVDVQNNEDDPSDLPVPMNYICKEEEQENNGGIISSFVNLFISNK